MAKYRCDVCGYLFDEQQAGETFENIYSCPICDSDKDSFQCIEADPKTEENEEEEDDGFFFEEADENAESTESELSAFVSEDNYSEQDIRTDFIDEFLNEEKKEESIDIAFENDITETVREENVEVNSVEPNEVEINEVLNEEGFVDNVEINESPNEEGSVDSVEVKEVEAENVDYNDVFADANVESNNGDDNVSEENVSRSFVIEKRQELWKTDDDEEIKAQEVEEEKKGGISLNHYGSVMKVIGEESTEDSVAKDEISEDVSAYKAPESDVIQTFYDGVKPVKTEEEIKAAQEAADKEKFTPLWGGGMGTVQKVVGNSETSGDSSEFVFEDNLSEKEDVDKADTVSNENEISESLNECGDGSNEDVKDDVDSFAEEKPQESFEESAVDEPITEQLTSEDYAAIFGEEIPEDNSEVSYEEKNEEVAEDNIQEVVEETSENYDITSEETVENVSDESVEEAKDDVEEVLNDVAEDVNDNVEESLEEVIAEANDVVEENAEVISETSEEITNEDTDNRFEEPSVEVFEETSEEVNEENFEATSEELFEGTVEEVNPEVSDEMINENDSVAEDVVFENAVEDEETIENIENADASESDEVLSDVTDELTFNETEEEIDSAEVLEMQDEIDGNEKAIENEEEGVVLLNFLDTENETPNVINEEVAKVETEDVSETEDDVIFFDENDNSEKIDEDEAEYIDFDSLISTDDSDGENDESIIIEQVDDDYAKVVAETAEEDYDGAVGEKAFEEEIVEESDEPDDISISEQNNDYIVIDGEENVDESNVAYSMIKSDMKYTVLYDNEAKKIFDDYPASTGEISNGLENIILLPAQCNPLPLERNANVDTKTVIGALTPCPVEVSQPFCFSKLFLWGEHIPNNTEPEEYANQALVLVKGKEGHIPNLSSKEELREEVEIAKVRFNGTPVGIDLVAGRIEADLEACVYAKVDYVILNDVSSRILPYALRRARNYLNRVNSKLEILVCVEQLKDAQELAKILALGANFVLVEKGFDLDMAAAMTESLKEICRSTGHNNVHDLNLNDVCTIDTDLAMYTDISHV